jgi:hypothetical protein
LFNSDLVESDITCTDYIKFYVNKGEEDVSCEFRIEDIDIFLQMIIMIVSGAISDKVISLILQNIDNEETKEHFMTTLMKVSQDNLSELSERSVIKPSEFQV